MAQANTNIDPVQDARGSTYVRAAHIILRYFNRDVTHDAAELESIQSHARQWCKEYFTRTSFNQIPLHEHRPVNTVYGTGQDIQSHPLAQDAPDKPWLLYHPDAFNTTVAPWRRFNTERAETDRLETTDLNIYYEETGYRWGVVWPECVTARSLSQEETARAIRHISTSRALRHYNTDALVDRRMKVTSDDLARDVAIVKYLPEFMVWLGHRESEWRNVVISDDQERLYRARNMIDSGAMYFGRTEKIRRRQALFNRNGLAGVKTPSHRGIIRKWRRRIARELRP